MGVGVIKKENDASGTSFLGGTITSLLVSAPYKSPFYKRHYDC